MNKEKHLKLNSGSEKSKKLEEWRKNLLIYGFSEKGINKILKNFPQFSEKYTPQEINEFLKDLKEFGFNKVIKMVEETPSLLTFDLNTIKKRLEILKECGFNERKIIKMVEKTPMLLNFSSPKAVKERLENLKKWWELDEKKIIEIVERIPNLLFNPEKVEKRLNELKNRGYSTEKIIETIEKTPDLL